MNLKTMNNKLASLPASKKILLLSGMTVFFGAIWSFMILKPQVAQITGLKEELATQQKTLQENLEICKNLPSFKKDVEKVKQELLLAQVQLPTDKEIPNLLTKISDQGNLCGLEFELFQPQKENKKDFYYEIPISIKVRGSYRNITNFFQLLNNLDRLVTIRDFEMRNPREVENHIIVETSCEAITYRFKPEEVQKEGEKGEKAEKG